MRARAVIGIPLAAAALALGGCGGGNGRHAIPRSDARGILTRLDQVDANVEAGKCGSAAAEVADLRRRVADLPRSVDGDVRRALRDGVATLARLVEDQCRRPEPTPTETTPTETVPTETTPTETVPTETTPTETVPTQTTPTQTAPSVPTQTAPPPTTPGNGSGGTPPGQARKGKEKGKQKGSQPVEGGG